MAKSYVTDGTGGTGDGSAGSETSASRAGIAGNPTVLALIALLGAPLDAVIHTLPGGIGGFLRGDIVRHQVLVGPSLDLIAHVLLAARPSIPAGSADGDIDAEVSAARGHRVTWSTTCTPTTDASARWIAMATPTPRAMELSRR